ncbi:PDZ domain-containing protein [candidate division KSB1 bacterium]|nr:PDZ domain-containing protein [candidate division KSB1 bacterium]
MGRKSILCMIFLLNYSTLFAQENYGGVGIVISRQLSGYLLVYDMAAGGPAETAGIKKGDLIYQVEDVSITKLYVTEVINRLKGTTGTKVKIGILRDNKPLNIEIVRGVVNKWIAPEILAGDCRNGYGKYKSVDGNICEGNFLDGKFHGNVKITKPGGETITYNANDGVIDESTSVVDYPDGRKYTGSIVEGVPHGSGTMLMTDGTERYGEWFLGTLIEGCFSGNCENGEGVYILKNKYKYSGEFNNSNLHGYGKIEYLDPQKEISMYIGRFDNNAIKAPGQIYYHDGNRYEGDFNRMFKANGRGKMYFVNGDYYEGEWIDGTMAGYGLLITKNGDYYAGSFKDGKPDHWITTQMNGKIRLHMYKNGIIDQSWQDQADDFLQGYQVNTNISPLFRFFVFATRFSFLAGPVYGDCQNGIGISVIGKWKDVYYGQHKDGKPNGDGEFYSAFDQHNNYVLKGNFQNGLAHGLMTVLYETSSSERIYYEGTGMSPHDKSFADVEAEMKRREKARQEAREKRERELAQERAAFLARLQAEAAERRRRSDDQSNRYNSSSGYDENWQRGSNDVCVSGDCENEPSIIQFGNGDYYQGDMKDGLFHGRGMLKVRASGKSYHGGFENGKFHGQGNIFDKWDNKLVAQHEHGRLVSGKAYNSDGCHVYTATYSGNVPSSYSYRSQSCTLYFGEKANEPAYYYHGGNTGRSEWSQETIYYNKGTGNEWSVTIPVRTRR